ncbi:LpxI family protein [Algirhabdus cladophorae]|uniref:LpxI family protein n=1 Tax=Algirhabdus cladophorae TaxID=3377108 RepID=UPI003B84697C
MTLALIAGQGQLPHAVMQALATQGRGFQLCALDGFGPTGTLPQPIQYFRVEELGSFIQGLVAQGIGEVCFAGAIARPKLDPSRIDAATMPLVPRMMQALQVGDDAALRLVLDLFQEAGLQIKAAHDVAPELLMGAGVYGGGEPSDQDKIDALRAQQAHVALSLADIGQACVAAQGQILAVEAMAGTDWMLRTLIAGNPATVTQPSGFSDPVSWMVDEAVDWLSGPGVVASGMPVFDFPKGGVFFKAPKTGQDRRIDLPTIGPRTVMLAAEAGLNGLVIEAGGVIVLDAPQVMQILETQRMFLWVREAEA